jgi:hypothetical protein
MGCMHIKKHLEYFIFRQDTENASLNILIIASIMFPKRSFGNILFLLSFLLRSSGRPYSNLILIIILPFLAHLS